MMSGLFIILFDSSSIFPTLFKLNFSDKKDTIDKYMPSKLRQKLFNM